MRVRPLLAWGLVCALSGCARPAPITAPQLLSVFPAVTDARAIDLEILGDGFLPDVSTDFRNGTRSALNAQFAASLVPSAGGAEVPLTEVTLIDAEVLRAQVPAGLPKGIWDLRVIDPGGREARLPSALQVVSSAESVAGFRFEPIGLQRLGVPFLALLTAIDESGQRVDGFEGTVTLSDGAGLALTSAAFLLGRGQLEVTPAGLGSVRLTALDGLGHQSSSVPYEVRAGLPARVRFLEAPSTATVSGCAGPVRFRLEDALGNPADLPIAVPVNLRSHPEGAAFFPSAGCAGAALARVDVTAPTELYVRAPAAGPLQLQLLPDGAVHAVLPLLVLP